MVQLTFVWTIADSILSHVRTAIRFLELMTLLMLYLVPSISVRSTSAAVTIKLKWTKLLSSIQPSPRHPVCMSFVYKWLKPALNIYVSHRISSFYRVREGTKFVLIILGPINTSSSWSLPQHVAVLNRTRVH